MNIVPPEASNIMGDYPGWEVWTSLNGQWHARLKGAVPPVMVHDDSPAEIRAQIARYEAGRGQ